MTETLTVVGTMTGEMQRNEWSEFHIDKGTQYPVKLATKKEEIKAQARALYGKIGTFTYTEADGNPNPHRPGEFYKNRYLVSAIEGAQQQIPQAAAPAPAGAAPAPPSATQSASPAPLKDFAEERRSIERQTIVKAVLPLYGQKGFEEWTAILAACADLDVFMASERVVVTVPRPTTQAAPSPGYEDQPDPDSDIPF